MPGCSQPEAFVEVWDLFHRSEETAARRAFDRAIAPVNRIANLGWHAFYHAHKRILYRRGVLATATVRGPIDPLDEITARELDQVIEELYGGAA